MDAVPALIHLFIAVEFVEPRDSQDLAQLRARHHRKGDVTVAGGIDAKGSRCADVADVSAWPRKLRSVQIRGQLLLLDRKSTRLNSSHTVISYAVFCLKKKKK